jgi:hypothetical protein
VPGISKDNIQVNVTDGTLTLKGEMKEEEKKEEKNYFRREFRYGAFTRTIALPVAVQADKTTAQLAAETPADLVAAIHTTAPAPAEPMRVQQEIVGPGLAAPTYAPTLVDCEQSGIA